MKRFVNCIIIKHKRVERYFEHLQMGDVLKRKCVIILPINLKLSSRDNVFNIIGAFDVPRYIYSVERKKFIP